MIKSEKGITIVSLVVTIIIILIIVTAVVTTLGPSTDMKNYKDFEIDITRLRETITTSYIDSSDIDDIGPEYGATLPFGGLTQNGVSVKNANDGAVYRVINLDKLNTEVNNVVRLNLGAGNLGINKEDTIYSGTDDVYIINVQSRTIYYIRGINYGGQTYYRISESYTQINVERWLENNIGNGSWNGTVNTPKLADGVIAVYWAKDSSGDLDTTTPSNNRYEIDQNNPNFKPENWYHYVAQTGITDGRTSRWANAKLANGSYVVWIPRYEYKITSKEHQTTSTTTAGTIDVKFISANIKSGTSGYVTDSNGYTTSTDGYIIHPAFTNNPTNGGWDKELSGIWVGKYESSNDGSGNVKIIPNVTSYRNINVSTMFTKSQAVSANNELTGVDSHMMKNSEWGCTAYLSHSQYGRNGTEVTINNSSDFYTGRAGSSVSDTSTLANGTYTYETIGGQLASTTGNIYGIYDMSGGAYEYVMGVLSDSALGGNPRSGNTISYHSGFNGKTTDGIYSTGTNFPNSKYYDLYNEGATESQTNNYSAAASKKGDAIYETSNGSNATTSWFGDYAIFVASAKPWLGRGGSYGSSTGAGLFCFHSPYGNANSSYSFRVVFLP